MCKRYTPQQIMSLRVVAGKFEQQPATSQQTSSLSFSLRLPLVEINKIRVPNLKIFNSTRNTASNS